MQHYPLAKMSTPFLLLTLFLWCLPVGFSIAALSGVAPVLFWPSGLMLCIYAGVWLLGRPSSFILSETQLIVRWPLGARHYRHDELVRAEHIDAVEFKRRIGVAIRVGAGGLWGVFGLLWSVKAGWVNVYLSSHKQFVWLEFAGRRPLIITPQRAAQFLEQLKGHS